jgi:thermitase
VDPTHPDLASRLVPGWSFLTGTTDTHDVYGHGTATAGTVGAATNNGTGVAGLTWLNPIMPLVVLNSSDFASYSDIANAITYAADHKVRVINVSIGGDISSSTLQSAVNYAWNKGSMVFASAMNAGTSTPYYPAACDNAIAVSATDAGDTWAGFSNYGSWVDFSAPGVNILTTSYYGGYGYWSGTSFSSPLTAGVAALILSVNPALSNSAVIGLLKQSSVDLGLPGFDSNYGWGRIDAYAAVTAARNGLRSDATAPSVTVGNPVNAATVSGAIQVTGSATDNVGVARIDFSIDGQVAGTATASPYAFPWNSVTAMNGSHTLEVRAYDAAGNTSAASLTVQVNNAVVSDTQAPAVSVVSPQGGTIVGSGKPVTISVAASDNVAVTQVAIYVDGVQVYTGSAAPFSYSWNTKKAAAGSHVIAATAWDKAGNSASAAPVTVTR